MSAPEGSLPLLLLDRAGDVATVTLNRPDMHNAFNSELIEQLTRTFQSVAEDRLVRLIILRGAGKSFCAGADVTWMRASMELTEHENIDDALRMSDMFGAIEQTPQAVIGVAHGAVLGGGMGLLAVCDIVVAVEGATFGFTEARLGIIPAVISRFVVPKIGPSWARRLFITGERFGVARAREIGLVHDVSTADEVNSHLADVIESVRASGPQAVREVKRLVEGLMERDPGEHRAFTATTIAAVRTSPEGQEGLRAFLERRRPSWQERR